MEKHVYFFEEGNKEMKNLLGNKGAQLAEMSRIGIPVPPGFVITTKTCVEYFKKKGLDDEVVKEIKNAIKKLEEKTGKRFGDAENPLLVSVRSGAPISMPGMMDTILNLGLTDEVVEGLAKINEWFAYDTYRRFIQMFGNIVMGIPDKKFEDIIEEIKKEEEVKLDQEISVNGIKKIVEKFKEIVEVPPPEKQLFMAVEAVFNSWNNERAINYRRINNLPEDIGTGVVIQTMVFGNLGNDSCTGIVFTRNPANGEKMLYGEFLINAQGEDIVAGKRTPMPIEKLKEYMLDVYEELERTAKRIEEHYKDVQDIEFTVERKKLYILQTRTAKRSARAAVKIAVDMVNEGIISREEAIMRVDASSLDQLLHKQVDENAELRVIATGLPASPGAAVGKVIFDPDEAAVRGENENIILVREETSPDDIHGVAKSKGILTLKGGMTSHAAVVSRGMGIPCVAGCEELKIDEKNEVLIAGDIKIHKDEYITIDGTTGKVIIGKAPLIEAKFSDELKTLLKWADEIRGMKVMANADTPQDARKAIEFGAEGIGLGRTEHMFLKPDRLPLVRKMILADSREERMDALEKLEEMQKQDFIELFEIMDGKHVTIRLLDPPLHEFLPNYEELFEKKCRGEMSADEEKIFERVKKLRENNPMLGHRGIRLAVTYPEIYEMQAVAIIKAAIEVKKRGKNPVPCIEFPMVSEINELKTVKEKIEKRIKEILEEEKVDINYTMGAMIELPRACFIADEIAREVEFISFGTNDLTQATFGYSRDDAEGKFLRYYVDKKILLTDPFQVLDRKGVGELMKIAIKKAKKANERVDIAICGEHGGEENSIKYCHTIGVDITSCSPYRIPIARLAAAQATIDEQ
ncbi:MAG: pyruvate, phosphate dikinase [Thermoplasmata archaeon]|nr:pyruvate, phosphate dikinase [Thermoplasmata archaeon]